MKKLLLTLLFPILATAQDVSIITLDSLLSKQQPNSLLNQLLKESVKQKKIENQLLENRLLGFDDLSNNILQYRQNLDAIRYPYAVPSTYYDSQRYQPLVDSILRGRN